jgi:2-polyprenyl-3-methyl-5-hydroxy-6-metoxy-1,4-benzoquinol methylase
MSRGGQSVESDIEKSRDFFNRRRPESQVAPSPILQYVFQRTSALLPAGSHDQTAIDLGCHWGRYTVLLAESYGRVIGVDFAEEALQTAEPRANITYQRMDLNREAAHLESLRPIHFFLAVAIFEMVESPAALLRQLFQVGEHGCEILALVPNRRSINYMSFRLALWLARKISGKNRTIYNNGLTLKRLSDEATAAGFCLEATGAIAGLPVYVVNTLPHSLQRPLLRLDSLFLKLFGGSYHWMLCRKLAQ